MVVVARRTFLATAAGATLAAPFTARAADPIRLGDINSYTRMAAFTEPYRKGLQLAVEQANAKGGVAGRPLELVSRDDAGEPGEAVKVACVNAGPRRRRRTLTRALRGVPLRPWATFEQ